MIIDDAEQYVAAVSDYNSPDCQEQSPCVVREVIEAVSLLDSLSLLQDPESQEWNCCL